MAGVVAMFERWVLGGFRGTRLVLVAFRRREFARASRDPAAMHASKKSAAPVHLVEPPIRSERCAAELEPLGGKLTDRLRARRAEADLPCLARKRCRLREGLAG